MKGVEQIMGASTRAAAFTAMRCGFRPRCVDYFADRDLAAVCPVERVEPGNAAGGFLAAADSHPPSGWFYTGGFENDPDLVERISRRHHLWGVGAEILRAIRNPINVARVLGADGIPSPEVRLDPTGLPTDGSWLVKPVASGGGRGIERLTNRSTRSSSACYYQRFVDGPSFSALFIGRGGRARLIGIARQWIGVPGSPFGYRGSIGPCPISAALAGSLGALGNRLASSFGLVGWFGVDYVLRDGIPWPVEVNPRYTASIEIHELATGRFLLDEHRRACEGVSDPEPEPGPATIGNARAPVIAKRILYARRRLVMPDVGEAEFASNPFTVPSIADVPAAGSVIERGEPVMTVFATGPDAIACCAGMMRIERCWLYRLDGIGDDDTPRALRSSACC
ncbi:MAG: ATP-grasp domain-containing protein [Isosphaeraceae bacterium]